MKGGDQPRRRPASANNSREDCWSDGATSVLISTWGDRYLRLNRGNLRQQDWRDVAVAVNDRLDDVKPPKTDSQCKNRIDTLKKKFKIEKGKPSPSTWPFYARLDRLIGNSIKAAVKFPAAVGSTVRPRSGAGGIPSPAPFSLYSEASASSSEARGGSDVAEGGNVAYDEAGRKCERAEGGPGGGAMRELARAIVRFGEVYERIENAKWRQMMELERQRMEFTKELEFRRMQMFMESQLHIEKLKQLKCDSGTSGKKLWQRSSNACLEGNG